VLNPVPITTAVPIPVVQYDDQKIIFFLSEMTAFYFFII